MVLISRQQFKLIVVGIQTMASVFVLLAWQFGETTWLSYTLTVGLSVAVLSILANSDNLLFFSRTVFIAWIGLIPALAIYMGGYFAWRMPFVQTADVAFIMTIVTTLALFSSQLGIEFGKTINIRKRGIDFPGNERIILYFILFMLVLISSLIAMQRGDLIFFAEYASESQGRVEMPFQNLQSIAIILMIFSIALYFRLKWLRRLSSIKRRRLIYLMIFVGIYLAVWCQFLRGARMDPLTLVFAAFVIIRLYTKNQLYLNTKTLIYLMLAFFVLQIWGGIRQGQYEANLTGSNFMSIVKQLYQKSERDDVAIFFREGTMNNLSLSVATVIYAIGRRDLDFRYGSSYVDYLARTAPEFIYPDRPKTLGWLSKDLYGGSGAGGGFNEMAEAFLNFGIFGALIVPAVISFLLSYSFRQFMINRYNVLRSIVFISMLSVFFRGLLYQTFAFYKTFVTALILYVIVLFVHKAIISVANHRSRASLIIQRSEES
jgi:hypothetical protein